MIREIVVASVSFLAGFLIAGIFAVDSHKKGDEVELLGKYISLARAYNVIVNTYGGEYDC